MLEQPPPVKPFWVRCAESAMLELSIVLWQMRPEDRTAILLAALDAEKLGTPEQSPAYIEAACHQCWREIKEERRRQWRHSK